ncbi:unnamed protein product [Linum trigynum]|uniref:Uncharacterized protein n=1 Tax=Linum trigynum TaxID=586398 RepID=A0AAV2CWX6_9ROSI
MKVVVVVFTLLLNLLGLGLTVIVVITTEKLGNRGCGRRVFGSGFRFAVAGRKVRTGDSSEGAPRRRRRDGRQS